MTNMTIKPVEFEKTANITLPKDSMEWNEKILKQFYEEHQELPPEVKADAVVSTMDDKVGYAKGSIVAWATDRKINFPIIINSWKLSPFDVFTGDKGETYKSASPKNIHTALISEKLGEVTKKDSTGGTSDKVLAPGGVEPKGHVNEVMSDTLGDAGIKLSFDWTATIDDDDLMKFASTISDNPSILNSIDKNITKKILESTPKTDSVNKSIKFLKPKVSDTITDRDIVDINTFSEINHGESGYIKASSLGVSKKLVDLVNGSSIHGTVINTDDKCGRKLFLSSCGHYYARCDKFVGTGIESANIKSNRLTGKPSSGDVRQIALISTNGDGETNASIISGKFSTRIVNDSESVINDTLAIMKSSVRNPVYTNADKDPEYNIVFGDRKILLVPNDSLLINLSGLKDISGHVISNKESIIKTLDNSKLNKVAMSIESDGIHIDGKVTEGLKKFASISGGMNVSEAMVVTQSIGMTKQASEDAINTVINNSNTSLNIYGVNSSYFDTSEYKDVEKTASINNLLEEYANSIKVDLIKEASVISDPTAVENILSTSFINKDNITDFVNNIGEFENTIDMLAEMLVFSRMGLSDLDEEALKKAIDGMDTVVEGLVNLRLVNGQ